MSNYPDDIGQYDNDPRSPFHVVPTCSYCYEEEQECECNPDEKEDWNEAF